MPDRTVYRGTAFGCDADDRVQALVDHLFVVEDGFITAVLPRTIPPRRRPSAMPSGVYAARSYWLPASLTCTSTRRSGRRPGRRWTCLVRLAAPAHAFPLEARFADVDFARRVYASLVTELLARGTTTALYFATVHPTSSLELVLACAAAGQRGLVGKVVMDGPDNPDFYKDADASAAVADTGWFIRRVQELRAATGAEVYPVITPRFIPSAPTRPWLGSVPWPATWASTCSPIVPRATGSLPTSASGPAAATPPPSTASGCWGAVGAGPLRPPGRRRCGAVRVHGDGGRPLPPVERLLRDAVAPVRRYARAGVDVGLGTDISGGFDPSLWSALQTVTTIRGCWSGVDAAAARGPRRPGQSRDVRAGLRPASLRGGRSLSLPIGRLAEGYAWDAQLIDVVGHRPLPIFDDDEPERILQRIITLATPANIRAVWVQGRKVVADGEVVVGH